MYVCMYVCVCMCMCVFTFSVVAANSLVGLLQTDTTGAETGQDKERKVVLQLLFERQKEAKQWKEELDTCIRRSLQASS